MLKNPKRDDLQCWRALSIIAVLLFHIWPEQFPNGYLGVDIFFVLSGFLMASLYSFDKHFMSSIIDFYYRRVKRILPIYVVVNLAILLLLSRVVYPEAYRDIVEDSKWAMAFASNLKDILRKTEYFETKFHFRFFRHCWSLAVEIQFYLVFPFIAIAQSFISTSKYQILLFCILCSSYFYQINATNAIIQYESLFCRVWQFAFGMLAQTSAPKLTIKWLPIAFLLSECAILLCSVSMPRILTSIVATAMASATISLSTFQVHPFKSLLRLPNAIQNLVILGDISYVIYLVHWPLITYSRFTSAKNSISYFDGFLLLMTSITLSKIVHHIVEKQLIKYCNGYRNLSFCLIVLYTSLIFIPNQISIKTQVPSNLTMIVWKQSLNFESPMIIPPEWSPSNDIEFATKLRRYDECMGGAFVCEEDKIIQLQKFTLYYCEVQGNPNGTLIGLTIGNSFSMNIVPAVSSNPSFKKVINVYASNAAFPIHDEFEEYLIEKLIKPMKPDVVFLVQQYLQNDLFKTPIEKIRSHKGFQHWSDVLQNIQNYTSAIILNKEQIIFPYDISQDYIRKKFLGLPIETKLRNPPPSPSLETWLTSLNCSKCQLFGYREAFCDGSFCDVIDFESGLPMFRDTEHISHIGIRRLKSFITNAINKALNISFII